MVAKALGINLEKATIAIKGIAAYLEGKSDVTPLQEYHAAIK